MDPREHGDLRRRFARACVRVTAFATRGRERRGPLVVENLSAGGALLVVRDEWRIGETFVLELRLDADHTVCADSRVVRLEPRTAGAGLAVQFEHMAHDAEDAIQEVVAAGLEGTCAHGTRAAIGISSMDGDIVMLARAAHAYDIEPLAAGTLAQALRWLRDPHLTIVALAIGLEAEGGNGLEVLRWCSDVLPRQRRVLLCSRDDRVDLRSGRLPAAHAIVRRPIDSVQLAAALALGQ